MSCCPTERSTRAANRFCNAQPGCCDFGHTGVDDVGYLTVLLDQAEAQLPVDTTHVYFMGHSNGGFMSYRMAYELGGRTTVIMSRAGAGFLSDTDCVSPRAVSVLDVHGYADAVVLYDGGVDMQVGALAATE
jgi:polyhydroxybutyrate depolymerase